MELYSSNNDYKLYKGSMLDMLDVIQPKSIDAIVTDPPYELNFMNKSWDNSGIAFQKETWQKCFEVLKPGGYLLAFGGSRTYHNIACAIEQAGFEIRDCIMYLYGCLSNDTEILTSNGWQTSETIKKDDYIYSLDLQKNIIVKNKCLNVFKYDYDGEMVNLKNQNTDQLLTPNHHCIVKDVIKTKAKDNLFNYVKHDYWQYKDAWQIGSQRVDLPLASNYNGKLEIGNLFSELLGWVISEGQYLKDTNAIMITQSSVNHEYIVRIKYILGKLKIKYSLYQRKRTYKDREYIEYDFYIGKQAENIVNKIKSLAPDKKLNWNLLELKLSNKEFLLKGLCKGDGAKSNNNKFGFSAFYQNDKEQLQIFQVLLHLTNKQGWINEKKNSCNIHVNPTTELQGKHYNNRFVKYNGGYVWCIETEIGNFVARRNGKIFITGNSGFPKSMNIGLALDKKNGVESNVIGTGRGGVNSRAFQSEKNTTAGEYEIRQAQNEWDGWGTALKPAYEPIVVARKPVENSVIENVLKYGVGGININECRVGIEGGVKKVNIEPDSASKNCGFGCNGDLEELNMGRFPSNVIHDGSNQVVNKFPDNESESASRFFYCAKASTLDRDEGLDNFEKGTSESLIDRVENSAGASWNGKYSSGNAFAGAGAIKSNIHPTVKPTNLMRYLVRLIAPKNATILDCFNGSGSTGKAVMLENKQFKKNYKYIGIELTEEYLPISKARIEYICNNDFDFTKTDNQVDQHQVVKPDDRITIFDFETE